MDIRVRLATAVLACALSSTAWGSEPDGKTLFNRGDYQGALAWFQQQDSAGHSTPANTYNIAVTLYRLQRYAEASTLFRALTRQPEWQPLADYNLGLIARDQGNADEARRYFRLAANQPGNTRIRSLAAQRLNELDGRAPRKPGNIALISLGGGHDSNAAHRSDDLTQGASSGTDNYTELLGLAQTYIEGRPGNGTRVYAIAFQRNFRHIDSVDSQVLGGNIDFEHPLHGLATRTSAKLLNIRVGGQALANELELEFKLSKAWPNTAVSLAWLPAHFRASSHYPQLDGSRQRLELGWRHTGRTVALNAMYRHETNDRADYDNGTTMASYSPTRDYWQGGASWNVARALEVGVTLSYEDSRYPGVDTLRDTDGNIKTAHRDNATTRLSAIVQYNFAPAWDLHVVYDHVRSSDSFNLYTYAGSGLNLSIRHDL